MTQHFWALEDIYLNPTPYHSLSPLTDAVRNRSTDLTAKFVEACRSETSWSPIPLPTIADDEQEAVGTLTMICPVCRGAGHAAQQLRGDNTGALVSWWVDCTCTPLRRYWAQWSKVPIKFRTARLGNLTPHDDSYASIERQSTVISKIKAHPGSSYLFCGDAGTGKTHYTTSLYQEALQQWATNPLAVHGRAVWMVRAGSLLESASMHAADIEKPFPEVTPEAIRFIAEKGLRPCLFVDEVEKWKPTDFKLDYFSRLIDAVYVAEGQLVLNSNLCPADLAAKWGPEYGESTLRRVIAPRSGFLVELENKQNQKEAQ